MENIDNNNIVRYTERLVSLTSIPTPYRLHFYKLLNQKLANQGVLLEVWFMSHTEPGRYWHFTPEMFKFKYLFSGGGKIMIGNRIFYLTPFYLLSLLFKPPKWLLLSGSWYIPTVILSSWLSKHRSTKTIFWNESNLAYIEHNTPRANYWRTFMLDCYDAYAVPGNWAKEYVSQYAPSSRNKPILWLPNVVNENNYHDQVMNLRTRKNVLRDKWNLPHNEPVLISSLRFDPIKGIKELIDAMLSFPERGKINLVVAGDGQLKADMDDMIQKSDCVNNIRLVGFQEEENLLDLLALGDGFILPSLGDPYPLAVIEALFAGLPLLLSNRVGCHPEALIPDKNGFLFDPYDISSIHSALSKFISAGSSRWNEMGNFSQRIAQDHFASQLVVDSFWNQLKAL